MSKDILQRKRILTKASSGSSISTPVSVANGGTGLSSYTIGDLLYASGATTLSKLADVATGNALISGGVGTAPSWGKIGLTTHITGGNWKTIYTNGSGVVTELALGSSGQVLQSNGASSAPTWVTPSSGITVGTTTITSGTSTRIPFNDGGVYGEDADFTWDKTTNTLNVTTAYSLGGVSFIRKGTYSTMLGISTGADAQGKNVWIGAYAGQMATTYSQGTVAIGYYALRNQTEGNSTAVGHRAGESNTSGYNNTFIGNNANSTTGTHSSQLAIGYSATTNASNQCVIGAAAAAGGSGVYDNVYFNGVTFTSPAPIVLNAAGGSGSNVSGASFTISGGKGTGTGTGGSFIVKTSTTLGTGTTLQSLVSRLTISGGAVTTDASTATWADALDFVFSGTTGTKFGTATTQKIGFWGVTPVTQYATTGTTTGFTANASANTLFNESTFTGDTGATAYTISDLVKALKLCGIILA